MNKLIIVIITAVLLIAGSVWWSKSNQSKDPNILATNGLHWHPILQITVKGEKQEIPPDVGVGVKYAGFPTFDYSMKMTALHTHDDAAEGIVHMEFNRIVRREDTRLGNFFKIWGKDLNSFGSNPILMVNGEPRDELGDYEMKDGDKIELKYE